MGDNDRSETSEETPDATVELHVDAPDTPDESGGDTTVIVVDGADGDGNDVDLDHEHRITALEHELADLRMQFITETPSREEVEAIVDDAVVESAVVADIVAEETAEEVAEEVAEETAVEVVEDVSPHKTHWLFRDWGEWTGKNGSGRVDVK